MITHYADYVKYIASHYFGWDGVKDEAGRTILQYIGTDVVRGYDEDYWVNHVLEMIGFFGSFWDYIIIPDCRFPNEIRRMKEAYEAIHVRVRRENYESVLTQEQQNHLSETALDDCEADVELINEGTIEEYKDKVRKWAKEIIYGKDE